MNTNLLIAVVIALLMVFAHIGVFWWFVCRSGQWDANAAKPATEADDAPDQKVNGD